MTIEQSEFSAVYCKSRKILIVKKQLSHNWMKALSNNSVIIV